jgi:23S rRNA (pseudouridine1915-N3)-methyltransferase
VKIFVLAIGRLKEDFWADAEGEYLKRLRRHVTLEVREVKDDAALLAAVPARAKLIVLDERGAQMSSPELAKLVGDEQQRGGGDALVFAIGGAEGFPDAVRQKAWKTLAFGRITLPHRLARVVLLEQIYRAFTILAGEPYHK